MNPVLSDEQKEILEGDHHLILISGDYWDCPTCNDRATLIPSVFWEEKDLLKHMVENADTEKMTAIWIADSWGSGDMFKFSEITSIVGGHRVHRLEFNLPSGKNIIYSSGSGGKPFVLATPEEVVLFGNNK